MRRRNREYRLNARVERGRGIWCGELILRLCQQRGTREEKEEREGSRDGLEMNDEG